MNKYDKRIAKLDSIKVTDGKERVEKIKKKGK